MTAPSREATGGSWVPGARGSGFDVDHLPYAAAALDGATHHDARVATRIGDRVLDLAPLAARDLPELAHLCEAPTLDALLAAGRGTWTALRRWLTDLLTEERHRDLVEPHLHALDAARPQLPFTVADYVDFYASEHHASNVGRIFRPDQEPLLPNWRHLPVGYHGRAGTVVPSGTGVVRPRGQRRDPDAEVPTFGPTTRLDLEAELGFVVGTPTALGTRVGTGALTDIVFGVVGLNDWSARDVQAWEYVPLGPFLGKSFATSIATWVTPLDALAAARCELPPQRPAPLPYLAVEGPAGYDVDVEVVLNDIVVARPPYATTYWSPAQMLAHLTANGASLRTGDLFASGTISGPRADQRGSLLELTWGWREPVRVGGGERLGLEDGDEVVLRYSAPGALGGRITLGEVVGSVLPAAADRPWLPPGSRLTPKCGGRPVSLSRMTDEVYTATIDDGVLVVAGEIDETAGPAFRQDLVTHSADFTRDLTVDLSDIEFFPSSAVAIAAIALENAKVHGTTVELVAREGSIAQRVLQICELPYRS